MSDTKEPQVPKKTKAKMNINFGGQESQSTDIGVDSLTKSLKQSISGIPKDDLQKTVQPITLRDNLPDGFDRNKIAFSAHQHNVNNVDQKDWKRIDDKELKSIAQADPYISAIISKRTAQCSVIGRASESKFDKGTRIQDLKPPKREDFKTVEDYKQATKSRELEMKKYLQWALKCGYEDEGLINTIFTSGDQLYKYCTLSDYISAQARNLLTFGRAARHTLRDDKNLPVLFRPAPVETIQPIQDRSWTVSIPTGDNTAEQSIIDAKEYNALDPKVRPAAFKQIIDGQDDNFLTEDDLKMIYFQKQAYFDLRGYPLAPIELAIYMVFIHQQTLGYLQNQFIKGITTKSILSIESTDPNYILSDEELDNLRNQFHNYIMRTDNSAVTPIISGPVKVSVLPLTASMKEMEFLQLEDHIIRALCSAMHITTQEMGYGYLGTGSQGQTQAGKQEEIIRGEETGLRMLLDQIYDDINDVMCQAFSDFDKNYRLVYVGVGEDTRDSVLQRSSQEINTTATMNTLLADSEKTVVAEFGGDAFLSPAWNQNVAGKMLYAEYRYYFLKDSEALQKPEYQFIIDPSLNQAFQALKVTPIENQQEQAKMQMEQMKQQMQMQEQQGQMQMQQAQGGQPQDGQPQQDEQAGPPPKKTMREKYQEASDSKDLSDKDLNKSMTRYFESWMSAHRDENLD